MPNTREKLIELLDIIIQPGEKTLGDIADHLIANGVTVQKWIPVSERLPEKDGDYLIYVTVPFSGSKFMTVMHYEKDASISIWQDTTHWQPLPEPPKGEADQ